MDKGMYWSCRVGGHLFLEITWSKIFVMRRWNLVFVILVFGIWVELVVFGRSSQVGVSVRDVDGT